MKKFSARKLIICLILLLVCIPLGYVLYVFGTYDRIEDNLSVEPINTEHLATTLDASKTYRIVSYNMGFGAYSADYSFFMDGGKYSRARSKEEMLSNLEGVKNVLQEQNADFVLMQEVDTNSDRSYHVNQYEWLKNQFTEYNYGFAQNYHSAYLFYPLFSPHGKSNSGIMTMSKYQIDSILRRSLPISTSVYKLIDLDRCYSISRIPTDHGKELVLINLHLSAYTNDESIVDRQIAMLVEDVKAEYAKGNYVICGGDFNQDLLQNSPKIFGTKEIEDNWAKPFPIDKLSKEMSLSVSLLDEEQKKQLVPSCRNADTPYVEGESFVVFIDGFILTDNVEMQYFNTIDTGFLYSDHNPVVMEFTLKN